MTRDTLNGLVAFITPGNDEYSVAQGAPFEGPGGIAAGTTESLIWALDSFVPTPPLPGVSERVPISGATAQALNHYALQVNPAAAGGGFVSHFSRLSYKEKGEVFRLFEGDPAWEGSAVRYLAALLPGFVASIAFSELPYHEGGGKLRERPVGWELFGYTGGNDGSADFKGYWKGHKAATKAHRYVKHPKKRRKRA